MVYSYNKTN